MSNKDKWKVNLLDKFKQHYIHIPDWQQEAILGLLDKHWMLCAQKQAHVFKRIPALMLGVGVGSFVDLSVLLSAGVMPVVLGRAALMSLSYMAGDYLASESLPHILPVLEKLEEHQLTGLFKKADNVRDLVSVLAGINRNIKDAIAREKKVSLASGAGVFVGSVVNSAMLKDAAVVAYQAPQTLAVATSFFAPLAVGERPGLAGVQTTWAM